MKLREFIRHLITGCDLEIKFSKIMTNEKKTKAAEFFHVAKAICKKCGKVDRAAYLPIPPEN